MLRPPEAPAPTPPGDTPSSDSPPSPSSEAGGHPIGLRATRPAIEDKAQANGAARRPLSLPRTAVLDRWRRDGMLALLGLAMVKLIVQLAVAGRYGFHRDELYYLAAGRHPSLGYVDYPPLTAMVARLSSLVFGHSLVGLRVWPALAGAVVVVLGGLIARELGGGRLAQVLAGFLVLCSPMFLGSNSMLQTVSFDELTWAVCLYLTARLVARGGPPRLWLAIGVAFGIGLETKYTILLLAMGLAVGLVLTAQRRWLVTPWPWLAALIAGALLAPNLVWQATHGWPTLEFLGNHNAEMAAENPPTRFLAEQLLLIGFAVVPLWIVGFVHLLRRPRFRMLGLAAAVVILVLLLQRAKSYYAGPVYPLLLAAGAVSFERFLRRQESPVRRRRRVRALIAALLISSVVAAPFALPVLPVHQMVRYHLDELRDDYAEMVGWPELVGTVAAVYRSLPSGERTTARVLAANYGEAGAVDWFGPRLGLPAAISGHDTYWFWRPRQRTAGPLITLGYERSELRGLCGDLRQVATITNRVGAANEERGGPVFLCRDPRIPLESWSSFRRFVS